MAAKVKLYTMHHNDKPVEVGYVFHCIACRYDHHLRIAVSPDRPPPAWDPGRKEWPLWGFNGNTEAPTFTPSLLIFHTRGHYDDKGVWIPGPERIVDCHLIITDGQIQYCSDCPHDYKGKTVPMQDYSNEETSQGS